VALPSKDQMGGGVIDTMIDFPFADKREVYAFLRSQLHDSESLDDFDFPVEYMFKGVPDALAEGQDPVAVTLGAMDRFGIEHGLVGMDGDHQQRALREHPDRFLASMSADANEGMEAVRKIRRAHDEFDLRAVVTFPAGTDPQVPIDGARWYPIYATCAELGLPVFICSGVPGPRVPMLAQHVELLDTVCYDFPELTIVTRHGCEPWEALAVKLMIKWPNLHYSTSAFAPKHYPRAIIDYANTRGADKVLYAGYYPMGLSLERIFDELPRVGFNDDVWPKFLRGNAARILGVEK
jgi:predicted TIM-barrel fold metal-dependent hydrolase